MIITRMATGVLFICLMIVEAGASGVCKHSYFQDKLPQIFNVRYMDPLPKQLCFDEFAIVHWGKSATPLWAAQRLTRENVIATKQVNRVDEFHPEERLHANERSELSHFRRSGYDRGHLAAAADMASEVSQRGSFSLANMIPQDPTLNRGVWASFESSTRNLALKFGEVYVITGVYFDTPTPLMVGRRVWVPDAVYKAVYVPSLKAGSAYWAVNGDQGQNYEVVSLNEVEQRTGIRPFPSISDEQMMSTYNLPLPLKNQTSKKQEVGLENDWMKYVIYVLELLWRIIR